MPFDPLLASTISNAFRDACVNRLNLSQRGSFEMMLMSWFGLRNIRNAQLWTRIGASQRNILNRTLGEFELDLRTFVADRFIQNIPPSFTTKTKCWRLPPDNSINAQTFSWFQDNWIREYCSRIYFSDEFFCVEYAADSDTPNEVPDLDSPEFDDLVED